ncbi:hypothetical protein GCM10010187_01820 [Actinomadura coerulea]|nr:hypothetical protein GCM10010187_01820 [Actinomadura coerulea]
MFGATGGTGVQVVRRALDAGHDVTAVVRDPAALPGEIRACADVVQADAMDLHAGPGDDPLTRFVVKPLFLGPLLKATALLDIAGDPSTIGHVVSVAA